MSTKEMESNEKPDKRLEKLLSGNKDKSKDKCNDILNDILKNKDETKQDNKDPAKKEEDDDLSDDDKKINSTEDATELLLKATKYKEEGNTHFQKSQFDKAARSYRRGCSALKNLNENNNGDVQVKSLLLNLQTNMSMVSYKQQKYKQSKDMASNALNIDECHVKALYRRGVAYRKLGDVDLAKADFKKALVHEPSNKLIRKELVSIKQELESIKQKEKKALQAAFSNKNSGSFLYQDKEEEIKKKAMEKEAKKQREKEAKEKRKKEWEDECVHRLANGEEAISFEDWETTARKEQEKKERDERRKATQHKNTYKPPPPSSKTTTYASDSSDSELDEKELASLRGYKKTADGKTTSYFTRELSYAEKSLIGDTAPKKIDVTPQQQQQQHPTTTSSIPTSSQSAWNAAQTWEERDTTDWCSASLQTHLENTVISNSLSDYHTKITKVDSITGHSSYALTSGRKRYIFDFSATVEFTISSSSSTTNDDTSIGTTEEIMASGSFILPDISSGVDDHHYEIEIKWDIRPKQAEVQDVVCRREFLDCLRGSVKAFVLDFNSNF